VESSVPESLYSLFWDIDPPTIRLPEHADYVIERVMKRGTWDAMCWLRRCFTVAELADFLSRKGQRLAPRELAYWSLVTGSAAEPATGGGRPSWAGP
jgi:hypothetical protein